MASEAPVIQFVNQLIAKAKELNASDIHIEPYEGRLIVRFRIDGVLQQQKVGANAPPAAIVSRIKIMANLDIAERRLPQDGRIKHKTGNEEFDMRISTTPTMHGESVVIRLLDRSDVTLDFLALGFTNNVRNAFEDLIAQPQGIMLVTGPTGSGKTTTLYTALEVLNSPEKKILTVEDPIEYQLKGINQIQVKPSIDLTFANVLRSFLRQDPDVIMIGEMRDTETARIAVQAALTGHKVLSTLHTNDAAGSIARLLDMQIDSYLLTSTINGILAQRLVRKLCPACKLPYTPDESIIRQHQLDNMAKEIHIELYRPVGCEECSGTGYKGRSIVTELLTMTDAIRQAINDGAGVERIRTLALEEGMLSLMQNGRLKAITGETSLEEVSRVLQSDSI